MTLMPWPKLIARSRSQISFQRVLLPKPSSEHHSSRSYRSIRGAREWPGDWGSYQFN